MHPTRITLAAVTLTAVALAIPKPAPAREVAHADASQKTLHLHAQYTERRIDLGPPGSSIGDEQVGGGRLLDGAGNRAGTFGFVCQWVTSQQGAALESCSGWGVLADGRLLVAGMSNADSDVDTWVITGGTGSYRGAVGQVRITDAPHGPDLTIELTAPLH